MIEFVPHPAIKRNIIPGNFCSHEQNIPTLFHLFLFISLLILMGSARLRGDKPMGSAPPAATPF
jgi:hypothetical protein